MSTYSEFKDLPNKYLKYLEKLKDIFRKYQIDSKKTLSFSYKNDADFKNEWKIFWTDLAKANGGKLSLTTIGLILGSALGGVGIAAMGGAIGVPFALLLGLGGFISGSKFDSYALFSDEKNIKIKISKIAYESLEKKSEALGVSTNEYINAIIQSELVNGD